MKKHFSSSPHQTDNKFSHQSGNILIYILGAIFLLGLLVVMVRGSSTPGSNIDGETIQLRISEVQQYGQELERAVAYILRNGYSESDIRFAHPDADPAYGLITDDPGRQVFAREGGAAKYRQPPDGIQTTPIDWAFNGNNVLYEVGSDCAGGSDRCTDLIAFLENVTREFCLAINNKNGITNPAGNPPQDNTSMTRTPFVGSYAHVTHIGDNLDLNGKLEGCLEGDAFPTVGTYHYYRVLLVR